MKQRSTPLSDVSLRRAVFHSRGFCPISRPGSAAITQLYFLRPARAETLRGTRALPTRAGSSFSRIFNAAATAVSVRSVGTHQAASLPLRIPAIQARPGNRDLFLVGYVIQDGCPVPSATTASSALAIACATIASVSERLCR